MRRRWIVCALAVVCAVAEAGDKRPPLPTPEQRAELKKRVDAATAKGVEWLKSKQAADGSFPPSQRDAMSFETGPTAVAMLALLVSGVYRGDACIEKGFKVLLAHDADKTYEAGLIAMAIEARGSPPEELRSRSEGVEKVGPRTLVPGDKEWLERDVEFLRKNRIDNAWSYPTGSILADNSNTQYALLGMKAAARCGVKVDKETWFDALQHFVSTQESQGPDVKLLRTEPPKKTSDAPRYYESSAQARGWGYGGRATEERAYGSMTCVGIASLLLCDSELRGYSKYTPKIAEETAHGIRDGLGWMQANYSVSEHPRKGGMNFYYYLYALERAGVLSATPYIGGHDWYFEGATILCDSQKPDGHWTSAQSVCGDLVDTCFALLFLRRATIPLGNTTPSLK
jgi:hypothetical protein